MTKRPNGTFDALKISEFRFFVGLRFFLTLAYQIQSVAILYHIYQLTHDPLSLGLVGLFEAIPSVGMALFGGYIADKYDKKKVMLGALSGFLICAVLILLLTLPSTTSSWGNAKIAKGIYAITFFIGFTRAFFGPTTGALIASIVPKSVLPNAASWSISTFLTSSILGPAIGGFLLGFSNVSITFFVTIACSTLAIFLTFFLKARKPNFVPTQNIWNSLAEGIRFVFKTKMLIGALTLDLFSVLFGGVVAVLPIFAHEVLNVGAQGFGLLRAASPLGAVISMLIMTKFSPMNRPWRNLLIAVGGFGTAILCFGLSKVFYLSIIFMFFEGVFDSVSMMVRQTIMQLLTPDEMRGRVAAVSTVFVGSSNEIGAFESGTAAKLLGTVPSVIFGGCMTLTIVFTTWLNTRKLTQYSLSDLEKSTRDN